MKKRKRKELRAAVNKVFETASEKALRKRWDAMVDPASADGFNDFAVDVADAVVALTALGGSGDGGMPIVRAEADRLLALREQAQVETCGAGCVFRPGDVGAGRGVGCYLPLGHEGRHRGTLGDWEWEGLP